MQRASIPRRLLAAVFVFSLCFAASAFADTVGFTINNTTGLSLSNPPFTLGFTFQVNSEIQVTQLGLFDDSQNGFVESHDLGLWDSGGNLLASGTMGSGTTGTLFGNFRYINIAPVNLTAGQTYAIGAVYVSGNDPLIFPSFADGFTSAPEITFNHDAWAVGNTLEFPTLSNSSSPSYFGPNFQFNDVPEPGSMLLLGTGLIGIASSVRRRMRK